MGSSASREQPQEPQFTAEDIINPSSPLATVINNNNNSSSSPATTTTTTALLSSSSSEKTEKTVNIHEDYRILALEGESGCVFCRVHGDMQKTFPRISEHGVLEFATRTLLRMNNITVARQLGRDRSMMGPLDCLANLEEPHRYFFTIDLPKSDWPEHKRFPRFQYHNPVTLSPALAKSIVDEEERPRRKVVPETDCVIVDATWISGKKSPQVVGKVVEDEYKKKFGIERVFGHSVFPDPGLLEISLVKHAMKTKEEDCDEHGTDIDEQTLHFPVVDATSLDLVGSGFNARVVRNDVPFQFLFEETHSKNWPRPVTYRFEPQYAHEVVHGKDSAGLFLETHEFTQNMTPADPDSDGFIVIGKWEDDENENVEENHQNSSSLLSSNASSPSSSKSSSKKKRQDKEEEQDQESSVNPVVVVPRSRRLHLLALQIPYGWTIIIDKNCIHGDTTFRGLYCMGMTTDHTVMSSADTVFVKNAKTKKNADFQMMKKKEKDDESKKEEKEKKENDKDNGEHYPVPVRPGLVVYKDGTLEELQKFDRDTKGASFMLQPFSKLSWTTTLFRRFGWYVGFHEKK